jgi:hypothetical protein
VKGGSRPLKGYAASEPLLVLGSFHGHLKVADHEKPEAREEVFVVKNASSCLLGAGAAIKMKVLKLGVEVNRVVEGHENPHRFPSIPGLKLKFDIDESVPPQKDFRCYVPLSLEKSLKEELERLERQEIIERATTTPTWVSRLKAVTKANGETRWVVTMIGPNRAIRRVYYPMPSMDKLATKMHGAKIFSKLDIKQAFFHVELDEKSREMTTFMTSDGPMRFTRLAFGVNCAPEAFQKVMEEILRECEGTIVYIDDILVFAESVKELDRREAIVREKLREKKLTINEEKCVSRQKEVEFLGYVINEGGMRPTMDKVRDVLACRRPSSTTGVKSLLGMVNFFGTFMQGLPDITEPLRKISGKNSEFKWGEEHEQAFNRIKEAVAEEVHTRGFFNEKDETWLYTDASPVGLGAVLVQINEMGEKRPIAFASKALTPTEMKYPQTHREALAAVWAVEKFPYYLIGREFNLVVDHQPLAFIFNGSCQPNRRATTRAEGYALRLSTYRFKVHVVKSEDNIADYMSRESLENKEEFCEGRQPYELGTLHVPVNPEFRKGLQSVTVSEIVKSNKEDEVYKKVREALETQNWGRELQRYAAFQDELRIQEGLLLREGRIVPPEGLRGRILRIAHLGHAGMSTMKRTIRSELWWPGLDADVEKEVKDCEGCARAARNNPPEPITRSRMPKEPWEYLAMDFHSPASLGIKLLVLVDYFTRLVVIRVMRETDASRVCDQLEDVFGIFGYPACVRADNGPPFASRELKEWCLERSIALVHSIPWAPWMNGEAEAQMRGIRKELSIAVSEGRDWKTALEEYAFAYNRRVHTITGEKPIEMMFKRKIRDLLPRAEFEEDRGKGPNEEQARDRDRIAKYTAGVSANENRKAKESEIKIGDWVRAEDKTRKGLEPKFGAEKFKVIEKQGGAVTIRGEDGREFRRCTNQLKKTGSPTEPLEEEDREEVRREGKNPAEDIVETQQVNGKNPQKEQSQQNRKEGTTSVQRDTRPRRAARPEKYINALERFAVIEQNLSSRRE